MASTSSFSDAATPEQATPDRATLPSFAKTVAILSALMAFASISTDLYLPAMPTLAQSLGGSQGSVELTLSSFLIGFSLGQLFWGPIGDRYGRRAPILFGLVLFMIGSAGCALAGSVGQLIVWRIVQAAGACAGPVLARDGARPVWARPGRAIAVYLDAGHGHRPAARPADRRPGAARLARQVSTARLYLASWSLRRSSSCLRSRSCSASSA